MAFTNLPVFALDRFFPQFETIASADFPCAHHDCGCKTAQQCRLHCCCYPKVPAQSPKAAQCHLPHQKPRTIRVSTLTAAQCQGHIPSDQQVLLHHLGPHLPAEKVAFVPRTASTFARVLPSTVARILFVEPPEKIPISLAV